MTRLCISILLATLPAQAQETIWEKDAKLKTLAGKGVGGEGPVWHPKLGVLSSGNGHINQFSPAGKSSIYRKGAGTNGLLFDRKGRLVCCDSEHRRVIRIGTDGKMEVLTERFQGKRYNTPNDLTIDSKDRIYFSDPRYGDRKGMEILDANKKTIEGVYRIDTDNKVTRVLGRDSVDRPNGVLVSGDDKYLYVADNNNDTGGVRKLWRFDLKKDGSVDAKSRKLLYDWGKGRGPDGLKQDTRGRLYVAGGLNKPNPPAEPAKDVKGGIYVLSPEGKLLSFLPVPTDEVTNCAFGGKDRKTLYVTGGGVLYSIRTTTPGRLVWPKEETSPKRERGQRGKADAIEFASPLSVKKIKDETVIAFTLKRATDVELAILDDKGRVVRHLAAGVLGGTNPPPAPLTKGLAQKITWDGKDDRGKSAGKGPFKVRLRAGTTVAFGRFLGDSTNTGAIVHTPYRAPCNGLVVDDKGNLIVQIMSSVGSHGNSGLWPWHLRRFDSSGKYLTTLYPYPPSTPKSKATGFDLLPTPGRFTPANRTSLYPVFAVFGNEMLSRLHKNQIVFIHNEKKELVFFSLDGTNTVKRLPMWSAKSKLKCPDWLSIQVALSPDGKYAYYSNVAGTPYDGKKPEQVDPNWPQGRIYRQDLTSPGKEPEKFFDLTLPDYKKAKYWMPSAWDKKTAAAGIDTDAKGNVLVCDLVNGQVVEISPEGKKLSATRVEWPDKVIASRKTGDFYVISRKVSRGYLPAATLCKFTRRGDKARVTATLQLKGTIGGGYTLDESGKVPVLWLGGQEKVNDQDQGQVWRVEDHGSKFVVVNDKLLNTDSSAISFVGYMAVDREAELVYVTRSGGKVWRYDGKSGKGGLLPIKAVDLAIGPGGTIYTWGTSGSYEGPVGRFTRALKPAPLAEKKQNTFGKLYGRAGRGSSVCGIAVDRDGRVFATYGSNDCHVRVYDSKGELVDYPRKTKAPEEKNKTVPAAVTGVTGYGGSIRVDGQGNIYLLQAGVPKGFKAPPGFEKDEAYKQTTGTIWKLPPTGAALNSKGGVVTAVTEAQASYPGCGPVSRWRAVGSCACTKPRFDVDEFGRVYVPQGVTFSVSIRDNANNEIATFGAYGNLDCGGPRSKEPTPSIPIGWPVAVGATDGAVYVGDCLNHRVVRVDRTYAFEKVLSVTE